MCGIVGYAGKKEVSSVLLVGLKRLEYRGYDSAGMALLEKKDLIIKKAVGKIEQLEKTIKNQVINGGIGIGHTRWATHGEPTLTNAHPHISMDQSIAVVHNGIIENYSQLKQMLLAENYLFVSETDTEVIPHLISKFIKEGHSHQDSFYKTLHLLEGKFAVTMISEAEPSRIYFAQNGAPLITALGSDENNTTEGIIASDLPAVISLAKEYYYLKVKEWGYFEQKFHFFDWDYNSLTPLFLKPNLKIEEFDKGKYEHYMLKEIYEQADILRRIYKDRIDANNNISFKEMNIPASYFKDLGLIIIQACGTSLNAGLIGKYYFESFSRIYSDADFSSEFRYRNPVIAGNSLVIGISQSGETADTLAGLHGAKAKFMKVLSFINNINSTMARESDAVVYLLAGPEIGVASTKAYIAELSNLYLFSLYLAKARNSIEDSVLKSMIEDFRVLPEKIEAVFKYIEKIKEIALYLKDVSDAIFLGRLFNYPTALEGALKLKEISYIHSSGYAAGEFKHGPIALISENVPTIVIIPDGSSRTKMLSNLMEVKARKGKIISIITEGDTEVQKLSDYYVEIPVVPEYLTPLIAVIPLQLIAYYTSIYRGCDVDKPRNLAKSVTVE